MMCIDPDLSIHSKHTNSTTEASEQARQIPQSTRHPMTPPHYHAGVSVSIDQLVLSSVKSASIRN